jgi:hypothetical protein
VFCLRSFMAFQNGKYCHEVNALHIRFEISFFSCEAAIPIAVKQSLLFNNRYSPNYDA